MKELISIIMPCYNASLTISKSIESIMNQTYCNWELLITDDCSNDNSKEVIEGYVFNDDRIKLYALEVNQGVANARNNSISKAKGSFIAFLDSDDTWLPTKLETQLAFMIANNHKFSYTAYRKIDNSDNIISRSIEVSVKGVGYRKLLKHNEIGCLTVMISKECIVNKKMRKIGHEDYVLWLSILKEGVLAYGINEVLASYRVGNESISSNKLKAAGFTWNIYRNVEKLNVVSSLFYFCNYAVAALTKYLR